MERVNKIFKHPDFKAAMGRIEKCEEGRIYCLHGFEHAMDVARIAYILNMEKDLKIEKSVIYATALLHDIGRFRQYEEGISHSLASSEIAKGILGECDFDEDEIKRIAEAILSHGKNGDNEPLKEILNTADTLSRMCLHCQECVLTARREVPANGRKMK